MFIRTKKIKKFEYAYKVKNKWTKSGTRQIIVAYLGRVHKPNKTRNIDFNEFVLKYLKKDTNYSKTNFKDIVDYLIRWELYRHGFNGKNMEFRQKNLSLKFENNTLLHRKKSVVLAINEGFLCGETVKRILNFKAEEDEEDTGFKLANVFVDAGIKIPKDIFVAMFEKKFKVV